MIKRLDHLVLTVRDIEASVAFYTKLLEMTLEEFGAGRIALRFGNQKINLHRLGHEFEPKANSPTSGSADLCFITEVPVGELVLRFKSHGVEIIEGPVARSGALGPILSIYFRDPDRNLIELANYAA